MDPTDIYRTFHLNTKACTFFSLPHRHFPKLTTKEIRGIRVSPIATNSITYLGVTLTKQAKDLDENNVKYLKKEIGVNIRR